MFNQPSRRRYVAVGSLLLVGLGLSGCTQNAESPQSRATQAGSSGPQFGRAEADRNLSPTDVARMLEPNVLGVSCFYDPFNPWIWNPEHTVVRGIKVNALYLRGPQYTGVFGDGTIHGKLYAFYRDEEGKPQTKLIKEWAYTVDEAMPFRAKRRTKAGWGYALFFNWGDLDLAGRSIRLTVDFKRADGIVISGSKKDFKVPKPNST